MLSRQQLNSRVPEESILRSVSPCRFPFSLAKHVDSIARGVRPARMSHSLIWPSELPLDITFSSWLLTNMAHVTDRSMRGWGLFELREVDFFGVTTCAESTVLIGLYDGTLAESANKCMSVLGKFE